MLNHMKIQSLRSTTYVGWRFGWRLFSLHRVEGSTGASPSPYKFNHINNCAVEVLHSGSTGGVGGGFLSL